MPKYYEVHKILILAATFSGLYFPSIEMMFGRRKWIKLLKVLAVFPMISLPLYLVFSLKYVFFNEGDLIVKVYGILQTIYSVYSTFVVFHFYYSQDNFVRAFELWDESFQEDLYGDDRQVLLRNRRKTTEEWLKVFGGLSVISAGVYSSISFFNEDKQLGHPSGIPYKPQSPDFEIAATLELFAAVSGCATLITYDSITMVFLSLEEVEFLHLKRSLAKIMEGIGVTDFGNFTVRNEDEKSGRTLEAQVDTINDRLVQDAFVEVERKLRIWIGHHQQVLGFHNELKKIFFIPLSMKYLAFVLVICLASFLTVAEGGFNTKDAIMAVLFCCNNYAIFYVNIKFADSIQEAAELIFQDAFTKSWNFYPKHMKTLFRIILMQSDRPVQFVPFNVYPLSSRSFLKILTSAYSFFTFLMHIIRKKS